ncbi:hypothetical protein DCS_01712 [Drechmeria coniospora]|uniref:Uncharacterized protein n=1 Tax=Drechmeria coniospora TaxID=98403 RepID=A0A151GTY8_DRECN|nr:hypothetical protein DCS_01712 [Drechmeria coniospora]KYK60575.1 hypothetical protein DCS_01712 [Drechmeria coniospora]
MGPQHGSEKSVGPRQTQRGPETEPISRPLLSAVRWEPVAMREQRKGIAKDGWVSPMNHDAEPMSLRSARMSDGTNDDAESTARAWPVTRPERRKGLRAVIADAEHRRSPVASR